MGAILTQKGALYRCNFSRDFPVILSSVNLSLQTMMLSWEWVKLQGCWSRALITHVLSSLLHRDGGRWCRRPGEEGQSRLPGGHIVSLNPILQAQPLGRCHSLSSGKATFPHACSVAGHLFGPLTH